MSVGNSVQSPTSHSADAATRRVWDWPVRIVHWALVLCVIGAYATHRLGIEYFKYHLWLGYLTFVLAVFRIVWGVIGTRHARFASFVHGPAGTVRYGLALLRGRSQQHVGHNPLGALMVIALLLSLLVQTLTGLVANDEILNTGPLYAYVSPERSLALTSLHRQLFYWIVAAIALHVLAVLLHLLIKKENLIKALLTGHKPAEQVTTEESISSSKPVLALLAFLLVTVLLVWMVQTAPTPDYSFDISH